jgi:1-acyl-sn-glycerol-3-phosphate acyltransferase
MYFPPLLPTLLVVAALFAADVLFWVYQGRLMQKSGHLPWRRSILGRFTWKLLIPRVAHMFVGKMIVRGQEKLAATQGPKVIVQNHTFQMDFSLAAFATRCHFFFMTKTSELRGIAGFLGALLGAISVNTKQPGGGGKAVDASVKALKRGRNRSLLVFPQGGLKEQFPLSRQDFENGAVRIAQRVARETGQEVWLVPIGTCYLRDQAHAPQAVPGKLVKKCRRMFGVTNYGSVCIIGDLIGVTTLDADADKATDVVFQVVESLTKQAMALADELKQGNKPA